MTERALDAAPATKLPVWRSVVGAYGELFGSFGAFLAAAALPFVLSFGISLVYSPYTVEAPFQLVSAALEILPAALFEVAWLRFLLIKSAATRPRLLPRPGRRYLRYVGYTLLLTLLFLPQILLPEAPLRQRLDPVTAGAVFLALYAVAAYLSLRFSFVLAWVAVDRHASLGASWRITRGNGLRLLFASALVGLPTFLAIGLLAALLPPTIADPLDTTFGIFRNLPQAPLLLGTVALNYALLALTTSIVARAFCVVTGWTPDRDALLERFE